MYNPQTPPHHRWTPQVGRKNIGAAAAVVNNNYDGFYQHQPVPLGVYPEGGGGNSKQFLGQQRRQLENFGHQITKKINSIRSNNHRTKLPFRAPRGWQVRDYGNLRHVGQGQFAEVLSGTDPENQQPVALKKIKLDGLDEKTLGLMYTEMKNLVALRHPNIVWLHRWFKHTEISGAPSPSTYLVAVMELVEGGDLERFLQAHTYPSILLLDESLIWHLFAGMCEGVNYMHARDYIHRDLKPANVLISGCLRTVKLADFGLSRKARYFETITTFTGTRYYMAPERMAFAEYAKPSDVWSLGCILYELASLCSPFFGEKENIDSLHEKVVSACYPPVPEDSYSKHLHLLILICLAQDPIQRPTAQALADAAQFMNKRLCWLASPEAADYWHYGQHSNK